ncbi:MAG: PAS domain-containing protein [Desulfatitalea sp.]|nr:PAS domain-containing protein [Desulfatitalea sp.]
MEDDTRDRPGETEKANQRLFEWETLFDTIGSGIWMLDARHVIRRSNRAAGELLHRPMEAMIGRHCWEVIHGTSQPLAQCPLVRAAKSKKRESLEIPIGPQWFEIVVDVVLDAAGRPLGYIHILNDITARKHVEAALQTSEKALRAIRDASPQSAFLMDTEGRVIQCNRMTAERLKTDVQALKDGIVFDFLPPAVAESRKKHVRQVIETRAPLRFEDERFGRTILNSIYPVLGPEEQVTHLAVFGTDITEEKRSNRIVEESKRQLAQANAMLQLVIDTIPVRIFWKDLNSTFLGCNRLFAQDAGHREPAEIIGSDDYQMSWKHQADSYRADDRQVMASGAAKINYEEPQDTPEGRRIWLRTTKVPLRDQDGRVMGVLGTYEDITDRKAMEERMRESEARYRNLFDNSYATMLVIDPVNGRIVDANAAACKYYGYTPEQLKAKTITEINTLTADEVFEEMARAKAEQRNHFYFYHRLAGGEVRPVEVYSGPIAHKGKHLLYSIVHDIGERIKAEQEKERLIHELRDALSKIKTLSGLLPICASCKKIRDDQGYWRHLESYIREHTQADFSHGICPDCVKKLYPEYKGPY